MGFVEQVAEKIEKAALENRFNPMTTNNTTRPTTILGIDFETYYGQHFSLTKLTTTVYVRSLSRREIHGASISINGVEPQWYNADQLEEVFSRVDWDNTAVLAHNAAFDGFILSQLYGVVAPYYYDTMSMARGHLSHDIGAGLDAVAKHYGLSGKVPDILSQAKGKLWDDMSPELQANMIHYCNMDVTLMWRIFNRMVPNYPHNELDLIDLTIKAFVRPLISVDTDLVKAEWTSEINNKEALLKRVAEYLHLSTAELNSQISSNPQFALMLRELGVEPPIKPSPTNPEATTFAFAKNDIAFQNLGVHDDPRVRDLISARLAIKSTISESRAQRVLQHSEPSLPIMLNYCKAHTMRWTGGDKINPQNFPSSRTDSKLRASLIPPKGYKLVVIDSSQIEDRMNAWVAGQSDVLDAYRNKLDNYKIMASRIYNVEVEHVTKPQRFVGKVARLGLGYQCGVDKFTYMLRSGAMGPPVYKDDLSDEDIQHAHEVYRETSSDVVALWGRMAKYISLMSSKEPKIRQIKSETSGEVIAELQGHKILMPNGLFLHYPEIRSVYNDETKQSHYLYRSGKNQFSKIYGGLLAENFIQCLARIVVGEQMLEIAREFPVVMMTHDEVVYLAPENEAEQAYQYGLECMQIVPAWCKDLPIDCDGGFGDNYGAIK